jgi:glyceraldehyde-3-phosphate dehydrogenase (NADP+)
MMDSEKLKQLFISEDQIPEAHRLQAPLNQKEYLVNGELKTWTGASQNVYSPVGILQKDGSIERKLIGSYPLAGEAEAIEALEAASVAYNKGRGVWPNTSVAERIACVEQFTKKMQTQKAEVVKLIMWEIGKSYADSVKEFDRTIEYIKDTIESLKKLDRLSSRFEIEQGIAAHVRRAPFGVVLCMGPYNYPLNETFCLLIPAIIMGNPVVVKPPRFGTLLYFPLLEAFKDSFPKGVVNTVYGKGSEIVPAMMKTGKIDVLALIGSSKVASELKKSHPKANRLRAVLGLDAKNAAIVTTKADIKQAVQETLLGALSFNGQRCTAIKIVFVHQSIAEEFNKVLSVGLAKLKFGMPWEEGVNITPLPDPEKPKYILECIKDAEQHGAKVINEYGGDMYDSFVYPAIVYPVNNKMKLYKEEQFAPIIPIVPFQDLSEPIDYIVDSNFGQQASIFSNDKEEVSYLIDQLANQVSRVNINSQCQRGPDVFPFTGRKDSAEGTLSVTDALRSFSIRTLVATKLTENNTKLLNDIVYSHSSGFLNTNYLF